MKICDWKTRDQNEKDIKNRWRAISFLKNTFGSSNFKNNVNCTILVPKYFSNLFLLFFSR